MELVDNIPIYLNGELVYGSEPGETPTPGTETPTPTPICMCDLGDVNCDGDFDIIDALLIAQAYVGLEPGYYACAADVNCDGVIDIIDALRMAQYFVGLITELC